MVKLVKKCKKKKCNKSDTTQNIKRHCSPKVPSLARIVVDSIVE